MAKLARAMIKKGLYCDRRVIISPVALLVIKLWGAVITCFISYL